MNMYCNIIGRKSFKKPDLKGYSTFFFLEIGSFYHSPKQLSFYRFRMYSDDFLIFRRISVTRHFLVSLTSIVYIYIYIYIYFFFPTMEVNETRNCLVNDILLNIKKSSEWI